MALAEAQDADALLFAADELMQGRDYLAQAQAEIENKEYGTARELALEAIQVAQKAKEKAEAYEALMRVRTKVPGLNLNTLMKTVPESTINVLNSVKEAEGAFDAQDYVMAKEKAERALQISGEFPRLESIFPEGEENNPSRKGYQEAVEDILEVVREEARAIVESARKEIESIRAMEVDLELDRKYPSTYIVKEGEALMDISRRAEIYNDPYQWPLIYKANRDQIRDPLIIFVGQKLIIPRLVSAEEVIEARKQAGAPPPYTPPPEAYNTSKYK
jgi:nucleoid-associated protein YgaU